MKCSQFMSTTVLVAVMSPFFVHAQPWPDPVPEPTLPEITATPVPNPGVAGTFFSNAYKFSLLWPAVPSTTALNNPPHPINSAQTEVPRWRYFWKFGDQTYSTDSMPVHTFPATSTPLEFDVEVSLKPIYSDDYDPFKKKKKKKVGISAKDGSPALHFDNTTYPMIHSPDSAIELQVNWRATRPGKGLTMAITYQSIADAKTDVSGVVGFLYTDNDMQIESIEGAPEDAEIITVPAGRQSPYPLRGLMWRFDGLNSKTNGQRTIFLDISANSTLGQLITNTSSIQRPVFAFIAYDDPQAGNPPNQQSLLSLIGASKSIDNAAGVSASVTDSYSFYQEITEALSINWAADPNYILVEPAYLEPGTTEQTLNYSVHFQNDGSISATKLEVNMDVDPLLFGPGVNAPANTSIPGCLSLTEATATEIYWTTPPPPSSGPGNCKLNGVGDAVALGFSTDSTWGKIHYDIRTLRNHTLSLGDTIRAKGTISMDGRSEITPVAIVPVGIPAFCYPGMLGLKFTQHFANDAVRSGWGLGLTLRYALGKVQNPNFDAHTLRRIRKNNFPLFWWQGELGYGQTSLQPGTDSLRLCHLDVTPVMLRFIARKPALHIGGVTFERGWGISAGYTASYLLASRRNGADDTAFDEFGFGDRLDHSISVSADFLNLIGRPGISVGAGWRWRNSQITGTREWYQNAFVYLHYTFSYRFRTEFGWLN